MAAPSHYDSLGYPDSAANAAAAWIARANAGLSDAEKAELQQWLGADARNRRAFQDLDSTWATLCKPRENGSASAVLKALDIRQKRRLRCRRTLGFSSAGLVLALMLGFTLFPETRSPHRSTVSPTMVVRSDVQTLPDGSTVELNAGAQIATSYSPVQRAVRLVRGEAMFMVSKDASRPFIVSAGGVRVRAVGTAFSIRYGTSQVDVIVTEGRVAIEEALPSAALPAAQAPLYLGAGGKVAVPIDASRRVTASQPVTNLTPAEIASALSWRGKRIEFTGTPLVDAVELFNRENRLQLSISDDSLNPHRITGIFWVDDPDGFVRLLEAGANVAAERSADRIVLRTQ